MEDRSLMRSRRLWIPAVLLALLTASTGAQEGAAARGGAASIKDTAVSKLLNLWPARVRQALGK